MDKDLFPQKVISKEESMEVAEEARALEYRKPSFAGDLFMGQFNSSAIFPFPEQTKEDHEKAEDTLKKLEDLLLSELDPDLVEQTREIPKSLIDKMAKLGVFAMKVPEKYRGLGFSQTSYNKAVMKVASYCGSTAVLISAHQSIGVPQPLRLYGTEAQKEKYLPRFREGAISAFALTELDVGSDPARMKTTATLSPDGKHYVLNGEKLWCTNGTIADVIIVVAKTAPKIVNGKEKTQITAFILDMKAPGVKVAQRCEFMGLSGIYNGVLQFTNVQIPVEDRLGDEGRGLAMALDTINVGRLTLPAACAGVAKQCLKIAREWGTERIQWGKPIALHEAGREKLSFIAATTFAMEAVSHLTSLMADSHQFDLRIEAAMAKLFTTEALWKIADLTLQLRGGRGYEKSSSLKKRGEKGYPIERIMRDCRINTILEGSSEIMKLFLAREALEPHLKKIMPFLKGKYKGMKLFKEATKVIGHYSVWLSTLYLKGLSLKNYKEAGDFSSEFKYIEKTSRKLARTLFFLMLRHQKSLEDRQMILGRIIEIATDLFTLSATLSYAHSISVKNGGCESSIELAKYFATLAKKRIADNFLALKHNSDREMGIIGKKVVNKDFSWLEKGILPL